MLIIELNTEETCLIIKFTYSLTLLYHPSESQNLDHLMTPGYQ